MEAQLLVVDDEEAVCVSLKERLVDAGYQVRVACDAPTAIARCDENVDVVILDKELGDISGVQVLRVIKAMNRGIQVVLMAAQPSVDDVVECMRRGADDYLHKPVDPAHVLSVVQRAVVQAQERRQRRAVRLQGCGDLPPLKWVGVAPATEHIRAMLPLVADGSSAPVLIVGESGTGKDLVAKMVHFSSARAGGRFLSATCSSFDEEALERELFGAAAVSVDEAQDDTARGTRQQGLLELADGGTLFLDEIGDMSWRTQAKLVRLLDEGLFRRLASSEDAALNVRVVAASSRDLRREVEQGRFREDLYHRLNVLPMVLPALRDRREDIAPLALHFTHDFARRYGKAAATITPPVLHSFLGYAWPGNVRQLRHVIERAVVFVDSQHTALDVGDFPGFGQKISGAQWFELTAAGIDLDQVQRDLVAQALLRTCWNQTSAAQLLGLNRGQIRYRIKKYGLTHHASWPAR